MPSTFDKLNLTTQKLIVVLNAPESFEPELASLREVEVVRSLDLAQGASFWLVFVIKQEEVDRLSLAIASEAGAGGKGDPIVWFAFIKGSSKLHESKITRDQGWDVLRELGFDPVRSVAINAEWSARGFRRVHVIKR